MVEYTYFDVKYLLGGSEKGVKETFVTCTPTETAARQSAPPEIFTVQVPEVGEAKGHPSKQQAVHPCIYIYMILYKHIVEQFWLLFFFSIMYIYRAIFGDRDLGWLLVIISHMSSSSRQQQQTSRVALSLEAGMIAVPRERAQRPTGRMVQQDWRGQEVARFRQNRYTNDKKRAEGRTSPASKHAVDPFYRISDKFHVRCWCLLLGSLFPVGRDRGGEV